jgi:hypothetical protein
VVNISTADKIGLEAHRERQSWQTSRCEEVVEADVDPREGADDVGSSECVRKSQPCLSFHFGSEMRANDVERTPLGRFCPLRRTLRGRFPIP